MEILYTKWKNCQEFSGKSFGKIFRSNYIKCLRGQGVSPDFAIKDVKASVIVIAVVMKQLKVWVVVRW